ncbi:MAG: hypothetical protein ACP5KG_12410, partial [Myxococcota bacterium]
RRLSLDMSKNYIEEDEKGIIDKPISQSTIITYFLHIMDKERVRFFNHNFYAKCAEDFSGLLVSAIPN